MSILYVALIERAPKGVFGLVFPDFPGCVAVGGSYEDVLRQGAEALSGHVDLMRRDGDPIPGPRDLDAIRAARAGDPNEDWYDLDRSAVALVPLLPPPGRAVRINITMDESLIAEIDAVSANRSAFLAEAARQVLHGAARPPSTRSGGSAGVARGRR